MRRLKAVVASALLLLTSCLSEPQSVSFEVEEGINGNSALSVDLITVNSEAFADQIMAPETDWFNNRQTYMAKYPKQLLVNHYQFVPGYRPAVKGEWQLPDEGDAIYLVAGNFLEGARILKVVPSSIESITIGASDFLLTFK